MAMKPIAHSVEELEPRAEEPRLKRPPGAGTEITKCGSGSFLFTKDSKKFYF
jgi:hypothetical protein